MGKEEYYKIICSAWKFMKEYLENPPKTQQGWMDMAEKMRKEANSFNCDFASQVYISCMEAVRKEQGLNSWRD